MKYLLTIQVILLLLYLFAAVKIIINNKKHQKILKNHIELLKKFIENAERKSK